MKLHRTLQWSEQPRKVPLSPTQSSDLPFFTDAHYPESSGYLPVYYETLPLRMNGTLEASIINPVYLPLNKQLYSIPEKNLRNTVEITAEKGFIKKQPVAALSLVPLRKNSTTGEIEKLVEFDIELRIIPDQQTFAQKRTHSYAS